MSEQRPEAVCPACKKTISGARVTSGIYEVFPERSGRKIWVKPKSRAGPYIHC